MNKEEYLQLLKKNLIHVSDVEKADAINYYTEYFEDAGVENEQKVIEELGSPVILARKIAAEVAIKEIDEIREEKAGAQPLGVNGENEGKVCEKSHDSIWKNLFVILSLLCSFPVWLPLSIVAVVLAFAVILVIGVFLLCIVVVGVALFFAGGVGIVAGIVGIFIHFFSGVAAIGVGLVIAGVGILLFHAGKWLTKAVIALIVAMGRKKAGRM